MAVRRRLLVWYPYSTLRERALLLRSTPLVNTSGKRCLQIAGTDAFYVVAVCGE